MENLYSLIGNRIQSYRKDLNMSQTDLAYKIEVSRTTLSNIESGKQKVAIDLIYKICNAFNITIFDFLPANAESQIDYYSSKRLNDELKLLKSIDIAKKNFEDEN